MADKDITQYVEFDAGQIDGESLPLQRCICGQTFEGYWEFVMGIYPDDPEVCPNCGRQLYFTTDIHVWEVVEDEQDIPADILTKKYNDAMRTD